MPGPVAETDRVEQLTSPVAAARTAHGRERQRELDVLDGAERADQTEVLEHEPHGRPPVAGQHVATQVRELDVTDTHRAVLRPLEAAENRQECRLAAARTTGDRDELARGDGALEPVEDDERTTFGAVLMREPTDHDRNSTDGFRIGRKACSRRGAISRTVVAVSLDPKRHCHRTLSQLWILRSGGGYITTMTSQGLCSARFEAVRDEFERNFAERGEVGAAVCITIDGETVVDLWGGVADPRPGAAWDRDTIGVVWSCTKGATALCAHVLVSRGEIDLDARVATYWPEFAENGKDAITVRMLLAHQAGLAGFREPIPDAGYLDWDLIVGRLAEMEPLWEPGARHGYHALTFGHLVGEVVRRVTGTSIGSFFRAEIGDPLGIDLWIGLPEEHEPRVAPTIPADLPGPTDPIPSFYRVALADPRSVPATVVMNSGHALAPGFIDTREAHAAELPGFGGVANARALARGCTACSPSVAKSTACTSSTRRRSQR